MASFSPSDQRNLKSKKQKEPNVIPIMNLFLVLIPALMTMMVSVHLAMIGINYSSSAKGSKGGEDENKDVPKSTQLRILDTRFEILVDGENTIVIKADSTAAVVVYDFFELDKKLKEVKAAHEDQNTIFVMTDKNVLFDTLMRSIDSCKLNNFTNVKYVSLRKSYIRSSS
ncbi:MAG: biopolymer transporter ExbD [Candidatus Cloacimonetes bacterium]|nr:biopolymer transporter ExbD [Candidatus Cloacimonadota bacterium]